MDIIKESYHWLDNNSNKQKVDLSTACTFFANILNKEFVSHETNKEWITWEDLFNTATTSDDYKRMPSWFRRMVGIMFNYYVTEIIKKYDKSYSWNDINSKIDCVDTKKKIVYSITLLENNIYQKIKLGEDKQIKNFLLKQNGSWKGYWLYWDKRTKLKPINL